MKRLLTATALALALPSAALAQVAAGTVPNTFDRPATAAPRATPAPTRQNSAPQAAAQSLSPTPANAQSEDKLRAVIASLQAGTPDYTLLTDDLATQMRAQAPTILPLIQGFGAIQSFDFAGSRSGADLFVVNFASAETEWIVGIEESGKVAALLFRPVDAAASSSTTAPRRP